MRVGCSSVLPILRADGFSQVGVFERHAQPDGDFPNVPDHIANPENAAVFDELSAAAAESGADLVLASDPDADRIGCAAPIRPGGAPLNWRVLSGNQLGVLLADYLLRQRRARGDLTADHYLIKTLVTTDMLCRLADHHGVKIKADVLTGFKWIGGAVDELGPEHFLFGCEEAHGYMAGDYIRDKDAALAAMLLAELAAELKARDLTLHQDLERLYSLLGYHEERTISRTLPGSAGLAQMSEIMHALRTRPPQALAGLPVTSIRDYRLGIQQYSGGETAQLAGPRSDLLLFFDTPTCSATALTKSAPVWHRTEIEVLSLCLSSAWTGRPSISRGCAECTANSCRQMETDLLSAGG